MTDPSGMWAAEPEGDLWRGPGAATQDMGALSPPRVLCCSQWSDSQLTRVAATPPEGVHAIYAQRYSRRSNGLVVIFAEGY
ncbi:hypothetical protein SKAU_G00398070 [Synaphobranchus kaupii]|uniref:Uncharacterized protein n=1 Tax=Synaphobranchus kaupii TaxID=118154 RepID=A0A9Q1IA43_SYNKA|nr:hypothetical protein SKAU_G00398070 [Synaphobranchus kaupii]